MFLLHISPSLGVRVKQNETEAFVCFLLLKENACAWEIYKAKKLVQFTGRGTKSPRSAASPGQGLLPCHGWIEGMAQQVGVQERDMEFQLQPTRGLRSSVSSSHLQMQPQAVTLQTTVPS